MTDPDGTEGTGRPPRGVVGVDYHRDWHWDTPAVARSSADVSPGGTLWLAIGDDPPQVVTVTRWLTTAYGLRVAVVLPDGREVAVGRAPAWFVGHDGPVVELAHGAMVQVSLVDGDRLGGSLPMGHLWPPDANPPQGPPDRGRGRRG